MNINKLNKSLIGMERMCAGANLPAIMSSFGKDSMVVLGLAHMLKIRVPVIYHRNPWFPAKNRFADNITAAWDLEVFDWAPADCGVKTHEDCIQPVAFYQYGSNTGVKIPIGILPPVDGERYLCGLTEIIGRPKGSFRAPWKTLIFGQKASDTDIFEGRCRLKTDYVPPSSEVEGPALFYPICDWTDDDVWDFIEEHNIPFQASRYRNRKELADKTHVNDYVPACMNCVDRRQGEKVFCPKLKRQIETQVPYVPDLEQKFDYIEYS